MALAFSQAKNFVGATGQQAVSFDTLPSAGDLIVVHAASAAGAGVLTCSDNQGNTYLKAIDGPVLNVWWCRTAAPSGTFTVTVGNGGFAHVSVGLTAYSGANADVGLTNLSENTGSGTAATPGNVTTTIAETLLITSEGTVGWSGVPTNYTLRSSGGSFNVGVATRSITSTGSHNPSWTVTDGVWECNILAFANGARPGFSSGPSITYASRTRTGPSNTWGFSFTATDNQTGTDALTYQVRTSATPGGGTLVTSGTCTSGVAKTVSGLAYNASGIVQGTNALWIHISDGLNTTISSQLTLNRDDSASSPSNVSTSPAQVPPSKQYGVTFDGPDTYSTNANEMEWQVRTAAGGGGTLLGSGNFTQGNGRTTSTITDSTLVQGPNNRYLRIIDGANNAAETLFVATLVTLTQDASQSETDPGWLVRTRDKERAQQVLCLWESATRPALLPFRTTTPQRELQWRVGGRVQLDPDLRWRLGGTVSQTRTLQWRVAPSPLRVHYALTGRSGPVSYTFRFERRTIANQYLQDVTPAILGGSIEANNDRDVFRTATFTVDANAVDDRGNAVTIDPLADHIAVYMDLLVDGSYTLGLPMGLFALNVPRKRYEPGSETWEIAASDNGIHLMEATTTASYTVAAAENYITGANAVRDILDDLGLAHALPTTSLTLPVARTWPAGTPWLRVVNDLLHAAGMYSLWFDASGIARTRTYDDLSTRTPDVIYTGEDFVLIPITEEAETTRLANQVVAVVDDPSRAVLTSVKTNADPDSPISTTRLGRTITRVLNSDAADQTTLDAIAENYLRDEAGLYRRATLLTSIDPRREAHEVYELTVDGVYAAERWWARNWRVQLDIGAQQQHTLGKVERVAAS